MVQSQLPGKVASPRLRTLQRFTAIVITSIISGELTITTAESQQPALSSAANLDEATRQKVAALHRLLNDSVDELSSGDYEQVLVTGAGPATCTFRANNIYVPMGHQVRNFCTEAARAPDYVRKDIALRVRQKVTEALAAYDANIEEREADITARKNSFNSAPMREVYASEAASRKGVYLLGELDEYASLPMLVGAYAEQRERRSNRRPIPQVWLFAVMHELVCNHPLDGMPADAIALRTKYLQLTNSVSRARQVVFPAWDAPWFHFGMDLDVENVPESPNPSGLTLTVYPAAFSSMEEWNGDPIPFVNDCFDALAAFVEKAYPRKTP